LQFGNKGWLRGIRHTISPTFGFSYTPNYRRYYDSVQFSPNDAFKTIYLKYADAIYGAPSSGGQQANLSYSFLNLFELKYFSKKDSAAKKMKLLEAVNIGGSYNMLADSFKFSQVTMSTGTNFFNGRTTLSVSALFDPYGREANGLRSRELAVKKNKRLLSFVNALVSVNTGISIGEIRDLLRGGSDKKETQTQTRPKIGNESLIDLLADFRLNHQFSVSRDRNFGRDTTVFQNALYTSGNIQISKKWRITVGNIGYDFISKQMTYPDFSFSRDLHCWEMGASWQPLRGTYTFFLRVKPGTLDFLKIPYNKTFGDAVFGR
jgi:hypothetical protein